MSPFLFMLTGSATITLGWLFFRKPNTAFWTAAPVWRANTYLKPPGVLLWVLGALITLVGIVAYLVAG